MDPAELNIHKSFDMGEKGAFNSLLQKKQGIWNSIEDHFDPENNTGDMLFLYEMTGFKVDNEMSKEFWDQNLEEEIAQYANSSVQQETQA